MTAIDELRRVVAAAADETACPADIDGRTNALYLAIRSMVLAEGTGEKSSRTAADATPELTIYQASHDSIVMGLYTTANEARAHCVAEERRTWGNGASPVFDWIEDEEDGVAELVTVAEDGETETVTGYVVTPLTVTSRYYEEADE